MKGREFAVQIKRIHTLSQQLVEKSADDSEVDMANIEELHRGVRDLHQSMAEHEGEVYVPVDSLSRVLPIDVGSELHKLESELEYYNQMLDHEPE